MPVVGPVKVSSCLPVRVLPLSFTDTALLPYSSNGVGAERVVDRRSGSASVSPTLMSSLASLASPTPVIASEDRLSLTSWPMR